MRRTRRVSCTTDAGHVIHLIPLIHHFIGHPCPIRKYAKDAYFVFGLHIANESNAYPQSHSYGIHILLRYHICKIGMY